MRTVVEVIIEGDHVDDERARRGVFRALSHAYEGNAVFHVTIVKEEVGTAYDCTSPCVDNYCPVHGIAKRRQS